MLVLPDVQLFGWDEQTYVSASYFGNFDERSTTSLGSSVSRHPSEKACRAVSTYGNDNRLRMMRV